MTGVLLKVALNTINHKSYVDIRRVESGNIVIGEHNTSITERKQLVAVPNEDQFVWNESWWLRMGHLSFGIVIDGCLELSLVVVWNCRWWLLGMGVVGCLELSFVVVWNCRWWLLGIVVGGCLEWTLVVVWN